MKKALAAQLQKYDALSLRERMMVAVAIVALLLFVADALLSSWSRQNAGMKNSIAEQRIELLQGSAQLTELEAQLAAHPDARLRARIVEIEEKIAALDSGLQSAAKQLVPPDRMATLLEDLLMGNQRLQLVRMTTLPAEELLGPDPAAGQPGQPGAEPTLPVDGREAASRSNIFKHGVELTLRGSYFDMLDYLTQIESLPWQMYWHRLKLDARDYHRPVLTLTLYTLSLDKVLLTL